MRDGYDKDPLQTDAELCAQLIAGLLADLEDYDELLDKVDTALDKLAWDRFIRDQGYDLVSFRPC